MLVGRVAAQSPAVHAERAWTTVVLMAVVAGLDPARIAALGVVLSRKQPLPWLTAYLVGGVGTNFAPADPCWTKLPLQDHELMTQGQDLCILVPVAHRRQPQRREGVGHGQIGQTQQIAAAAPLLAAFRSTNQPARETSREAITRPQTASSVLCDSIRLHLAVPHRPWRIQIQ